MSLFPSARRFTSCIQLEKATGWSGTKERRFKRIRSTLGLVLDINGGQKLKPIPAKSGEFK